MFTVTLLFIWNAKLTVCPGCYLVLCPGAPLCALVPAQPRLAPCSPGWGRGAVWIVWEKMSVLGCMQGALQLKMHPSKASMI